MIYELCWRNSVVYYAILIYQMAWLDFSIPAAVCKSKVSFLFILAALASAAAIIFEPLHPIFHPRLQKSWKCEIWTLLKKFVATLCRIDLFHDLIHRSSLAFRVPKRLRPLPPRLGYWMDDGGHRSIHSVRFDDHLSENLQIWNMNFVEEMWGNTVLLVIIS